MSLNYPLYRWHNNARLRIGNVNSTSIAYTKGPPQFTGAEFQHVLRYIKEVLGFHVYANSHHGGIHLTAHGPNSWHYVKDAQGRSLGADIGTYRDINERNRIINDLIPVLDRIGMAWVYARNGHVPNHHDHIHIDVGIYGNKGGPASTSYGFYQARRRVNNVYTALPLVTVKKRAPKRVNQNVVAMGSRGDLVRIVQRAVNARVKNRIVLDGIAGNATVAAIREAQRSLGVTADGRWGAASTRAFMSASSPRRNGHTGTSVQFVQWVVGTTTDGIFGKATEQAVKECQAWAGITVDGIAGPQFRARCVI